MDQAYANKNGLASDRPPAPAVETMAGDILVVDDNAANLIAIEAALGTLQSRVMRAQSGSEALRLMLDHDFALVLLDVNMPAMGGFETARIIRARKRSRHTPIIFITAYGRDDRDVLAAYELGAVDFLFKPIVPQVLTAKASVFVELQKRSAEVARQAEQIREHERREHRLALEEERHRWEEQAMRREMEQLAEADKRKDQFLAVLAHELRTPLSPVVTGLDLLREKLLEAGLAPTTEVQQIRATMERQARYLTRLVDDLLDISRISSGKIELHCLRIDLREIVTNAAAVCAPVITERRHQLRIELPPEPLWVLGDEVRLIQIVANLLNNAARYTPEAGEIDVSAWRDGEHVELCVRDNGQGIAHDVLPRVFELFVQGKHGSSDGLGLGLSVVQRLATLHGGTATAHSEGPGLGSAFALRLPLDDLEPDLGLPPARTKPEDKSLLEPAKRPLQVVVVEDNADIREMLSDLLSLWKHEIVSAEDGESGAELVIARRPDVALIDIGLPTIDGYTVAARIRERLGKAVKLVAMTGYGQETDRERAIAAGFDVHLVKPVSAEALKHVLSHVDASEGHDASRSNP